MLNMIVVGLALAVAAVVMVVATWVMAWTVFS
jgi:hypothetical protein